MARNKVLALILAGGSGSRLEMLTERRSKPAAPFGGIYRLIDFSLSNCMHSGIADVWVVEQYRPHSLNDHLANGRPWDLDRTYGGLRVLPPYEGSDEGGFARGNADAIYRQKEFIQEFDPDVLLVLSADHIYKLDYQEVIRRHYETGAEVTAVSTRVPIEEAARFGTLRSNTRGEITGFDYKPKRPQSGLVTTEVFVYDTRVLFDTLDMLLEEKDSDGNKGNNIPELKDYGHELLPRLVERGKVREYPLDGYWKDLGTVESYWKAHMDLLEPEPGLCLDDPGWPIISYGVQQLPAHIFGSAALDNSLISPGCSIRGKVVRSVLGPGVVVEEGATVRNAVIFGKTVIRSGARVDGAVIDEHVTVAEEVRIGRRGKRDLPVHLASGEITLIGANATVQDDVKPGARVRGATIAD